MNIKTGGLRQKESVRISKQRAFILHGSGVLSAGENSDDLASGKAERRREAAASTRAASTGHPFFTWAASTAHTRAANMNYYNIRVNVLRGRMGGAALASEKRRFLVNVV